MSNLVEFVAADRFVDDPTAVKPPRCLAMLVRCKTFATDRGGRRMPAENTHADEIAVLEELEQRSGDFLSSLSAINQTLRHHNFRLRDLRSSPYSHDERLKLFSIREQKVIIDLREAESTLVDLLPVRDVLFDIAELKEPENEAASAALMILMGGLSLAVLSGIIMSWIAYSDGGIDDWNGAIFIGCIATVLFAWGYVTRKRDELRARRVWRSARERTGF